MKPWMRTAVAVVLVLAIAAGGFFLPNLVRGSTAQIRTRRFRSAPATRRARRASCARS